MARDSYQIRYSLVEDAARPSPESWNAAAVAARFARAAEAFDVESAMGSLLIRDGINIVRQIRLERVGFLDVGCGFGQWSAILRALGAPYADWRYAGLEASEATLAVCRAFAPEGEFQLGDVEALPFADRSMGVVFCSGVLMYTADWRRSLAELARVAGRFLCLLRTPIIKYRRTARCRQRVRTPVGDEHHLATLFNRAEFEGALRETGMETVLWDYTEETHRVEGLEERVFYLNHLLSPLVRSCG